MPSLQMAADQVEPVPFVIPGATGGTFRIQVLNEDTTRGVVTTIVHIPAGGHIPAHRHQAGAEMHFLLEGDLREAGQEVAHGTCLTHAAGVVHGPHESRGGARLLTVQSWQSHNGDFDFEPAEESGSAPAGSTPPQGEGETRPVDQKAQQEARQEAAEPEHRGYS
ncbi:cupin domain-containing protein [Falsiroseomonas tokyonensis]|uniref:Cupin domain-containing protein n=1 Tax=Falsiroseomonas tokyonensis TaxID=430521 RepID=A0ABV7BUB9_9PROT|nr:cupin domain-containing protein [Falsiroseomonas tokyonensis]MBU8539254.1 cupin domain-containing protein [Falsiroseomonas tokyonensis]